MNDFRLTGFKAQLLSDLDQKERKKLGTRIKDEESKIAAEIWSVFSSQGKIKIGNRK